MANKGIEAWGGPEDGSYLTIQPGSQVRIFAGGAYGLQYVANRQKLFFVWQEKSSKRSAA